MRAKYIRTMNDEIIVFSAMQAHSDFKRWEPKSAGFIKFFADDHGRPKCHCYGESTSLGIKSNPEVDTEYARRQIIGEDY